MKRSSLHIFLATLLVSSVCTAPVSKHKVSGMKAQGGQVVENLEAELLKQAGEAKKDGEGLQMFPMIKKADKDDDKAEKESESESETNDVIDSDKPSDDEIMEENSAESTDSIVSPPLDDGNPIVANKEMPEENAGDQQAEGELQELLFALKNNPQVLKALINAQQQNHANDAVQSPSENVEDLPASNDRVPIISEPYEEDDAKPQLLPNHARPEMDDISGEDLSDRQDEIFRLPQMKGRVMGGERNRGEEEEEDNSRNHRSGYLRYNKYRTRQSDDE